MKALKDQIFDQIGMGRDIVITKCQMKSMAYGALRIYAYNNA